jgi:2-hydroxy-3-oxopropionate reductase
MYKIGFIGLGIMGKPMAGNLLKAGYPLIVYDINSNVIKELVNEGAKEGKSSKDVASQSEVIITMLPNSPDVKDVILGKNGVIEGVKSGSIVIDMSSIAPSVSKEIAEKLHQKNVVMLDAPVSGGEPKAIEGTLAIMVGGPEETFNRIKDI